MKVWGDPTKKMDHLHRRATQHLENARVSKSSSMSRMPELSEAAERKVQRAAYLKGRKLGKRA